MSELLSDRCCWLRCCFRTILQFQAAGLLDYLVIPCNLRGRRMNNQPLVRSPHVISSRDVCCLSHMTSLAVGVSIEWAGSSSWSHDTFSPSDCGPSHPLNCVTLLYITVFSTNKPASLSFWLNRCSEHCIINLWDVVTTLSEEDGPLEQFELTTSLKHIGFNEPLCDCCWVLDDWTVLTRL